MLAVLRIKMVWLKLLSVILVGNAHCGAGLWVGKAQLLLLSRQTQDREMRTGQPELGTGRSTLGCRIPAWVQHTLSAHCSFHPAPISFTLMLIAKVKSWPVGLKQDGALEGIRKMMEQQTTTPFSSFPTITQAFLFLCFVCLTHQMNKSDSTLKIISNSKSNQNLKLEFQSLTLETNIQDNC